jgi:hypothetical protein
VRPSAAAGLAAAALLGLATPALPGPAVPAPRGVAPASAPAHATETSSLRVAYPEEPIAWHPALSDLPATVDLAALWGLPLYRLDHRGLLRPVLAESAEVLPGEGDDPWTVSIRLREGAWSDGTPVTADDVAFTVEELRRQGSLALGPLSGAQSVDERTVELDFDRPYARWPYILAGGWSVLPAHVLRDQGLDAYRDDVPVSGGPFQLDHHVPGLRAVFVAQTDAPVGPPGLDRVEVYFTPSYETSLGLLRDRRVDVAMGHIVATPVQRAARLDAVHADAPLGGTWALVEWSEDGMVAESPDRLRAARDALGIGDAVESLLGRSGEPMTSTIPGLEGPWTPDSRDSDGLTGTEISLVVAGRHEILATTGRLLQQRLHAAGGDVTLIRIDHDDDFRGRVDGTATVRRDPPRPSLRARTPGAMTDEDAEPLLSADAAGRVDSVPGQTAQQWLFDAGHERPLFRVAVAHVWHEELQGMRASSWPGIGFWDAVRWHWPDGPPPQEPTIRD